MGSSSGHLKKNLVRGGKKSEWGWAYLSQGPELPPAHLPAQRVDGAFAEEGEWYIYSLDPRLGCLEGARATNYFRNSPTVVDSDSLPFEETKSSLFYCPIPLKYYTREQKIAYTVKTEFFGRDSGPL